MLTKGTLSARFKPYFDEMEKCRKAGTYWALLHISVCLADICSALQAPDGKSKGERYKVWSNQFAPGSVLTGAERWNMRNKVLHQGRAITNEPGRYSAFAFGQPAETGEIDHGRVDGSTLHVDVGELSKEMVLAVKRWIEWIESNSGRPEAVAVEKHLPSLVSVARVPVVRISSGVIFDVMKTN